MSFDPTLGQLLDGKQLPTIPPNATPDHQIAVMNQIIDALNNNTQEIVATGTLNIAIDGSQYNEQTWTVPHNLGYKPRAFAYLNSVTLNLENGTLIFRHVDIPLPTTLSSDIPAGGGGGGPLPIAFYSWLDLFVDATNLYIHHRTGNPLLIVTLPVTYYLTRQPSN